jgi:hypothetical protein
VLCNCPCARTCCFCGGPPHTSSREEQVSRHASQQNAPAGVHGYLPAQGVWRELDALPYRVGRRRSHSNSAHSSAYHGSDRLGAVPVRERAPSSLRHTPYSSAVWCAAGTDCARCAPCEEEPEKHDCNAAVLLGQSVRKALREKTYMYRKVIITRAWTSLRDHPYMAQSIYCKRRHGGTYRSRSNRLRQRACKYCETCPTRPTSRLAKGECTPQRLRSQLSLWDVDDGSN